MKDFSISFNTHISITSFFNLMTDQQIPLLYRWRFSWLRKYLSNDQYFSFYYKVIWLSRDDLDIPMWPDWQTFLNLEIFRKKQCTNNFFSIHSQISNCTSKTLYLVLIPTEKQHFPYISISYFNFCLSFFQFLDHISPTKY